MTKISNHFFAIEIKDIWHSLRQEPSCFWFLCFYLFFEYVRPQSLYPVLDILPWAKLLIIAAVATSFSVKKVEHSPSGITILFWGLVITVLLSSLFAEFPDVSFAYINVVFNWLIVYYLFLRIVTTKFRFFVVILLIMMASYKMSQHGALSWARRGFTFERWGVAGTPGFFGNAADFGIQMIMILPLSVVLIRGCSSHWGALKRWFFIFFPFSVIMSIIATGSRSTFIGLIAICLATVIAAKNKFKNMILMAVLTTCLIWVTPQDFLNRFDTAGSDTTSQSRLRYWKRGYEFFQNKPLLGIGYNNWSVYYMSNFPGECLREDRQEVAHSTPITVLAELGGIGFFFYYSLTFSLFIVNIKSIRLAKTHTDSIWKEIPFALNIGILGFLIASLFISVPFYPFLFIHAGLSVALKNLLVQTADLAA